MMSGRSKLARIGRNFQCIGFTAQGLDHRTRYEYGTRVGGQWAGSKSCDWALGVSQEAYLGMAKPSCPRGVSHALVSHDHQVCLVYPIVFTTRSFRIFKLLVPISDQQNCPKVCTIQNSKLFSLLQLSEHLHNLNSTLPKTLQLCHHWISHEYYGPCDTVIYLAAFPPSGSTSRATAFHLWLCSFHRVHTSQRIRSKALW